MDPINIKFFILFLFYQQFLEANSWKMENNANRISVDKFYDNCKDDNWLCFGAESKNLNSICTKNKTCDLFVAIKQNDDRDNKYSFRLFGKGSQNFSFISVNLRPESENIISTVQCRANKALNDGRIITAWKFENDSQIFIENIKPVLYDMDIYITPKKKEFVCVFSRANETESHNFLFNLDKDTFKIGISGGIVGNLTNLEDLSSDKYKLNWTTTDFHRIGRVVHKRSNSGSKIEKRFIFNFLPILIICYSLYIFSYI